jgi:peroxiredoxin Q/BCP
MRTAMRRSGKEKDPTLVRRGAPAGALQAGQIAPDFSLPDEAGRVVSLTASLVQGPVVLVFLDGGERKAAEAQLPAATECATPVAERGGTLLAISSHRILAPADVAFTLLRDADSLVATRYGLGRSGSGTGRSATFVIDQSGMTILSLIDAKAGSDLAYSNVLPVLAALTRRAPPWDSQALSGAEESSAQTARGGIPRGNKAYRLAPSSADRRAGVALDGDDDLSQ